MKKIVLVLIWVLMIGCWNCSVEKIDAKTRDTIKYSRYIQCGKSYNLAKFLKETEEDSFKLQSIPKSDTTRWKTKNSNLLIKKGKIKAKKNGTYKMYAVTKNEKYVIEIVAVSSQIGKINANKVKYIEITETHVGKKRVKDIEMIRKICSKINSVKWKFNYSNSNRQKFGSAYSISFYMKSGSVKRYTIRDNMLQNRVYYKSTPTIKILDYVDGLYKELP